MSDSDNIDSKKKDKNKENPKYPDFWNFIKTILYIMTLFLLLFTISAGAIVNATNPEYRKGDDFLGWPGADINGPPYVNGETQQKNQSAINNFFDLNQVTPPYNADMVQEIYAGKHKYDTYPKSTLYPWAVRMTALSYSWMRLYFQESILSMLPSSDEKTKMSMMFMFGWFPLLCILYIMPLLSGGMTLLGAIQSFGNWAWIGTGGLLYLFMWFFVPGFVYLCGLFWVPVITCIINMILQPWFYLGFLVSPLFTQFKKVKEVMMNHFNVLIASGVFATILSASVNSNGSNGFVYGVIIMSVYVLYNLRN